MIRQLDTRDENELNCTPGTRHHPEDLVIEVRVFREEKKAVRADMQEIRSAMLSLTLAVGTGCSRISDLAAPVEANESWKCHVATKLGVTFDEGKVVSVQRFCTTRRTNSRNSERPHPSLVRLTRRAHCD
ncbi:hypothetical protein EVAR_90578_1 [Eumeta japonica]|uniref:Uncharacterized protein n=1 Tax=Eumeta variegata TaxID=151549 RepID=A0A4C1YVQ8_EUMVA|nr:hypothetical protein EVAR_90578_1 [Eumeta japonica]